MTRLTEVTIAPWDSLEADCLRHLLIGTGMWPTARMSEDTSVYVLTVPRKLSPWPVRIPDEVIERGVPVVLVVDYVVPWSVALARSVEAQGLVSWSDSREIVRTVKTSVAAPHRAPGGPEASPDPLSRLTERERQVITLVTKGDHDQAIAARLGISVNTVRSHVQHCLTKLDVSHRHAAAAMVRKSRLPLTGREVGVGVEGR